MVFSEQGFPLISVVTVCRNAEATIARTLQSIQQQIGVTGQIEHLVIDGVSTDRTSQIASTFPGIRWNSEPDKGISDAFNKGLQLARGEYLLYLNADDYLADAYVLRDVMTFLTSRSKPAWVVGDTQVMGKPGDENSIRLQRRLAPLSCWSLLFRNRICHQSVFVKRSVLVEAGGFDTSYHVAMDYELWYRLCRLGYRPSHIERVVSVFSLGGISSSNSSLYRKEKGEVTRKFRYSMCRRFLGFVYDLWKK